LRLGDGTRTRKNPTIARKDEYLRLLDFDMARRRVLIITKQYPPYLSNDEETWFRYE
jgi:hypothetical protein